MFVADRFGIQIPSSTFPPFGQHVISNALPVQDEITPLFHTFPLRLLESCCTRHFFEFSWLCLRPATRTNSEKFTSSACFCFQRFFQKSLSCFLKAAASDGRAAVAELLRACCYGHLAITCWHMSLTQLVERDENNRAHHGSTAACSLFHCFHSCLFHSWNLTNKWSSRHHECGIGYHTIPWSKKWHYRAVALPGRRRMLAWVGWWQPQRMVQLELFRLFWHTTWGALTASQLSDIGHLVSSRALPKRLFWLLF